MNRRSLALALAFLGGVGLAAPHHGAAYMDGIFDCARFDAPCEPYGRLLSGCRCHGGVAPENGTTRILLDGLPTEEGWAPGETYAFTVWVLGVPAPLLIDGCPWIVTHVRALNNLAGFNLEATAGVLGATEASDGAVMIRNETECDRLERITGCGIGPFAAECPPCDDAAIVDTQASHTLEGNKQLSWRLRWTAPEAGSGPVRFYVAGNVVNGNCRPDLGDVHTMARPGLVPGFVVPERNRE